MSDPPNCLDHSLDLLKDTYNYNHWIYYLLRPYLGDAVLEVGSGCGNITRFLLDRKSLACLEPEPRYAAALAEMAAVHRNIRVAAGTLEDIPRPDLPEAAFDTVVCVNVLEHIQDDVAGLVRMRRMLAPGGRLLLYVPAGRPAYGALDQALGHYRRYTRRELAHKLESAGLRLVHARYVNFVGLLGWWWTSRVRRRTLILPAKARLVDKLVPYLSAWERLVPPVRGQSCFVVAQP